MLSILHVIDSLDPARGGPSRVVAELAAAQINLGHRVGMLSGPTTLSLAAERVFASGAVEVRESARPSRLDLLTGRAARRLAPLVSGYDVLHLHGVWDTLLYGVAAAARRAAVPYVVAPHGMLDPWCLGQKRWKKRLALALGFRKMLNRAAALHMLNADEERLIRPLRLRCPAFVLPNGVAFDPKQVPPPGSFRAHRPELQDDPYILFLSRLHRKKGLDYLIDAFAVVARAIPAARLVIAGPDDGARAEVERTTREAGLADRVHLVGPLYGAEKWSALADAACICLPSRQEGFSVAILEALVCGVPVVISEECHFPEVAESGAGLVVPLDAARIAAALRTILTDTDGGTRMGRAGRELVAARYTWPQIAAESIALYQHLRDAASPVRSLAPCS